MYVTNTEKNLKKKKSEMKLDEKYTKFVTCAPRKTWVSHVVLEVHVLG